MALQFERIRYRFQSRYAGSWSNRLILTSLLVFFSYAVVTIDEVILFITDGQMTEDDLQYLGDQVRIKPYTAFFDDLKELPSTLDLSDKSVSSFLVLWYNINHTQTRKFF